MLKTTVRYEYSSIPAGKSFKLRLIVGVSGFSKPERPRHSIWRWHSINPVLWADKSLKKHSKQPT
jgi:hypothetical protein